MRFAAILTLCAALLPVGTVAAGSTARIGFASISPVSVRGAGFKPGERVTVTVSAKVTRKKIVTASARGAFRATFKGLTIPRCRPYGVQARGNRGSIAGIKLIPECAPPAPPDTSDPPLLPSDPRLKNRRRATCDGRCGTRRLDLGPDIRSLPSTLRRAIVPRLWVGNSGVGEAAPSTAVLHST
jgi:hypothetical protein